MILRKDSTWIRQMEPRMNAKDANNVAQNTANCLLKAYWPGLRSFTKTVKERDCARPSQLASIRAH
jgi:hypothetical protein